MRFLPGDHHTGDVAGFVVVKYVDDLTITSHVESGVPTVGIHCSKGVGFAFVKIRNLSISGIAFHRCGVAIPERLKEEAFKIQTRTYFHMFNNTKSALFLVNVLDLNVSHLHVHHSDGYGLFAMNILGFSVIVDSGFFYNNYGALNYHQRNPWFCRAEVEQNTSSCTGGNAVFLYQDTPDCPANTLTDIDLPEHFLQLFHVEFSHGVNLDYQNWVFPAYYLYTGGGLSIFTGQSSYRINIWVENATIDSNIGYSGANVVTYVNNNGGTSRIIFHRCKIMNGNRELPFFANRAYSGGLYFYYGTPAADDYEPICQHVTIRYCNKDSVFDAVNILHSTFANNSAILGAAIYFLSIIEGDKRPAVFNLDSCHLYQNTGYSAIVHAQQNSIKENATGHGMIISLQDSNIHHNRILQNQYEVSSYDKNLTVDAIIRFQQFAIPPKIKGCTIRDNNGTGLFITNADVLFSGTVRIEGNVGDRGGGISVSKTGYLTFSSGAVLILYNNKGSYGGGLFIEDPPNLKLSKHCFFDLESPLLFDGPLVNNTVQIQLQNNTATIAGNSLYGGLLETCFISLCEDQYPRPAYCCRRPGNGIIVFKIIFQVSINNSLSEISSDPKKVCFCYDKKPQCSLELWNATAYPGESFHVPAVAVGQLNGTVPAVVLSKLTDTGGGELALQQDAQQLTTECGELIYTISTTSKRISLTLQINSEQNPSPSEVMYSIVSLNLPDCPLGFELREGKCNCISFLAEKGITCNIDTLSFQRPVPLWIGHRHGSILIHSTCPFDYCKTDGTDVITLNSTDVQCAFNRSGILCGSCKEGFSLVFGTSRCQKCSNAYIALLLPFLVAGIALILLLIYCDLTVAKGTINGMIFYANIVRVNHNTIFPAGQTNVLTVFIAWLNLDLGIEACFYNGMDEYGRTWLQFLFPAYIWALVGIIIVATWYSSLAVKILGSNAITVLSTLFLLSYTKLQRTILSAFSFTLVGTNEGDSFAVWLQDGNVSFFNTKHAVLFTVALIVAVGFIVPFTLIVLCGPCLQAKFGYRMLKLKFTPILDAYQGPYKDKFRYWTGILLLIRSSLLLVFAVNALGNPRVNLMLIVSTTFILLSIVWNFGTVYKQRAVNVVETFYIANLGLLAVWTEFNRQSSVNYVKNQAAISYTMVGSAFIVFLIIISYHVYLQIKNIRAFHWCKKEQQLHQQLSLQPLELNRHASAAPAHPPTVSFIHLREPLMSNCS